MRDLFPRCLTLLLSLGVVLLTQSSHAEAQDPIATDRPGNANAGTTVPPIRLQIETSVGYALEELAGGTQHFVSFPTLARLGLTDFFELRLGSALLGVQVMPDQDTEAHATDTTVGTKVALLDGQAFTPQVAVSVDVSLPSGGAAFTSDVVVPDARLLFFMSLPAGFGILLNAGADLPDEDGHRFGRVVYVANVGYSLPALDGSIGLFIEVYGRESFSDRPHLHQLDWGATWRIEQDVQLDFFVQHALTALALDFQLAVGLSVRI